MAYCSILFAPIAVSAQTPAGVIKSDSNAAAQRASAGQQLLAAARAYNLAALNEIIKANPKAIRDADAAKVGVIQQVVLGVTSEGNENWDHVRNTVAWLLDHDADPDVRPEGQTLLLLSLAINVGDLGLVNLLLAKGANPNMSEGSRQTPFNHILSYYPSLNHPAGRATAMDLFEALIGTGSKIPFDPNRTVDGMPPLVALVMSPLGNVETAQKLMALGADLKAHGSAPYFSRDGVLTSMSGEQLLIGSFGDRNMLGIGVMHAAVLAENEKLLRFFLSKGVSINDTTANGNTPLHYAAIERQDMVPTLLALHADPNIRNNDDETPAEFVVNHRKGQSGNVTTPAAFKNLLKATDLSRKNRRGFTLAQQVIQAHNLEEAQRILPVYHTSDRMELADIAILHDDDATMGKLLASTPSLARRRLSNGRTLLHTAVLWQATKAAALLLKAGADAGARDAEGSTPLSLLLNDNMERDFRLQGADAKGGQHNSRPVSADSNPQIIPIVHLAEMLIDAGANVNACGSKQSRPLPAAVTLGSLRLVKALIRHGAQVNTRSDRSMAAIVTAKSAEMVDLLIHLGADINGGYFNPLIHALQSYNFKLAHDLIMRGADVNASWGDDTALLIALDNRQPDLVRLLINKGADVNAENRYGQKVLSLARWSPELVSLLKRHGATPSIASHSRGGYGTISTPMIVAVQRSDLEAVKAAFAADPASINPVMLVDPSPIRVAIEQARYSEKQRAIIQFLLENGADVKHGEAATYTMFDALSNLEIFQLLLDHGAPINARNSSGRTVLFEVRDPKTIQFLVAHGADPNDIDFDGNSPLHFVMDYPDAVEALLAVGAKPAIFNNDGDMPIHKLLRRGSTVTAIPPAIVAASDLTVPGSNGLSAFQGMLEMGTPDIRKALLAAKPMLDDYTAFLEAVSENDVARVRKALSIHPDYVLVRFPDGATALHIAAVWKAQGASAALLAAGADAEARDSRGETPMQWTLSGQRSGSIDH